MEQLPVNDDSGISDLRGGRSRGRFREGAMADCISLTTQVAATSLHVSGASEEGGKNGWSRMMRASEPSTARGVAAIDGGVDGGVAVIDGGAAVIDDGVPAHECVRSTGCREIKPGRARRRPI